MDILFGNSNTLGNWNSIWDYERSDKFASFYLDMKLLQEKNIYWGFAAGKGK